MPMRVTIVLDSGVFLSGTWVHPYFDVGFFEPQGSSISVWVDPRQPIININPGTRNSRIDVQHIAVDGTVRVGPIRSRAFASDLLSTTDLYDPKTAPDFIVTAFDCILRFHSGDFQSADVRPRQFKEVSITQGTYTGRVKTTRPIANDVVIVFDLLDGEALRFTRDDGTNLLSTDKVMTATKHLEIQLSADGSTDEKYYSKALQHRGGFAWLPNPDPPPWTSAVLPGAPTSPARRYVCPRGDYESYVAFYDPFNPPQCPTHKVVLVLKP